MAEVNDIDTAKIALREAKLYFDANKPLDSRVLAGIANHGRADYAHTLVPDELRHETQLPQWDLETGAGE